MPETASFPDYAFNKHIHILFSCMECFPDYIFSCDRHKSPLSLLWVSFESGGKQTFTWAICSKICCVACLINHAGKLIYLCACLHKQDCAGLIDKPEYAY